MKALAVLVCSAVLTPAASLPTATPSSQGISQERLAQAHQFVQRVIDSGDYLGAVTLVARNGKVVDSSAFGHRDLARTSLMRPDAIFRIYSMTKPLATVAVLELMEEGKLGLEDPIGVHLPEFASMQVFAGGTADAPRLRPASGPITIRHLLTHTAGFATSREDGKAYERFMRLDLDHSPSLKAYAEAVSRLPLATDPGTRFHYDGVPIEILSRLVEVISGTSFDTFLQQRILAPLGLVDTGFSVPAGKRTRIADLTTTDERGRLMLADTHSALHPGDMLKSHPGGAGGLYSTAADYARFCQMLLNGGELQGTSILDRRTVALMMTNQLSGLDPPEFRPGEGFGLGGYVVLDGNRRGRPQGQFGWFGAASTWFTIDREKQLVAILLLQHLPQGLPQDPPKISPTFYDLVYESLEH
jgi:CubicO group peptidase (beta-lactamase class C family)